jgi:alkylation response protein AidB-like acyl-CoA dehydrogenase
LKSKIMEDVLIPMDAFLTPEQKALRQDIRDYFREAAPPDFESAPADPAALTAISRRLKDLGYPDLPGSGPGRRRLGLIEKALIIEEVSAASPELGRAIFAAGGGPAGRSGPEDPVAEVARDIGTAAAVLSSCLGAARDKGLFESTLMDHQKAQTDLADALSGLEAARLKAYRALRLLDRGDGERGDEELRRVAGRVREILGEARALASALAGGRGPTDKIAGQERSRP